MTRAQESTIEIAKKFGLNSDEFEKLHQVLGRTPTIEETAIAGAMWSEHCSYKSSRVHLKRLHTEEPWVVQGPGENAGVISINEKWGVAFKMESHNHPSAIEPYQGAATGVGGILRDVFCMGARPIANLNCLRFGEGKRNTELVKGCVEGIGDYGNSVGVPTVGGQTHFHAAYTNNILVNAFTAGIVEKSKIFKGVVSSSKQNAGSEISTSPLKPGTRLDSNLRTTLFPSNSNLLIYFGSATGRDGVHGATMSSSEFTQNAAQLRPTVQVGDPFAEKQLLEATLALIKSGKVVGLQDMGAAGLTSSGIEMAARSNCGVTLNLDCVPMRVPQMNAWEILLSESQERMLCAVEPQHANDVIALLNSFDLPCSVIGQVNETGLFVCLKDDVVCAAIPVQEFENQTPRYEWPLEKQDVYLNQNETLENKSAQSPLGLDAHHSILSDCTLNSFFEQHATVLEKLIGHPNFSSRSPLFQHYCSTVQGNSIAACGALQESAAAVIRLPKEAQTKTGNMGIALAAGCEEYWVQMNPKLGAELSMLRLARRIVATGGTPLAVTDCLNFGSLTQPPIARQFSDAIDGISNIAKQFQIPVVSGNVSLNNQTNGVAIPPTPMLGMVGSVDDVTRICFRSVTRQHFLKKQTKDLHLVLLHGSHRSGRFYLSSPIAWELSGTLKAPVPSYDVEEEKSLWRFAHLARLEFQALCSTPVGSGGLLLTLFEMNANSDTFFSASSELISLSAKQAFATGCAEFVFAFPSESAAKEFCETAKSNNLNTVPLGRMMTNSDKVSQDALSCFINKMEMRKKFFSALSPFFTKVN